MRSALKTLVIIWLCVSALSLAGLLYLLPSYVIVGAFAEGFRTPQSPQLVHWFHFSEMGVTVSILMAAWLWRTHRKHYGNLWKSN
jgi:chromate transport protein ChrA